MSKGLQADLAFKTLDKRELPVAGQPDWLLRWDPAQWPVSGDWQGQVDHFLASATAEKLGEFIGQRLAAGAVIYPPQPFRALELTPLDSVRVVVLGQDPYHGPGQAHGLAFSVPDGVRIPPSLRNIFKELARDPEVLPEAASGGSLERWARQGVLLLNTGLTVEDGSPGSHAKQGWENFTDQLIAAVAAQPLPTVFMLWGAHAQAKHALIGPRHLILSANHPSPLSALRPPRPFIGCGHFSAANTFLRGQGRPPVQW